MAATQTTDETVTLHASAFNLGLSVCDSANKNVQAMDTAIAYTSDFISLLTETQASIDDINNAELQDQIDLINTQTKSEDIQKSTATYNLMSSQASASDQQFTSEESTFNSENSNRADSVNSFNSTVASIMSGLSSLASLLAK